MSLITLDSTGGNETLYQLFNSMLRAIGLAYTTGTVIRALIEVLGAKRKTLSLRVSRVRSLKF